LLNVFFHLLEALEDLTGVRIDEDAANMELQAALDKTRKLKQKKNKLNPDMVWTKFTLSVNTRDTFRKAMSDTNN